MTKVEAVQSSAARAMDRLSENDDVTRLGSGIALSSDDGDVSIEITTLKALPGAVAERHGHADLRSTRVT